MFENLFPRFSDKSRIWVYGFKTKLTAEDLEIVHTALQSFVRSWKSHSRYVEGDYLILENQFMVFAISEKDTISGCSIDSSIRILEKLRDSHGLDALDPSIVFFKRDYQIKAIGRNEFRQRVSGGLLDDKIFIYDLSIQNLGQLRRGEFIKPYKDSWAAIAFPIPA